MGSMGSSSQPTEMAHGLDDQILENGLGVGLSMSKGPHTQNLGPIRPVITNCIFNPLNIK